MNNFAKYIFCLFFAQSNTDGPSKATIKLTSPIIQIGMPRTFGGAASTVITETGNVREEANQTDVDFIEDINFNYFFPIV